VNQTSDQENSGIGDRTRTESALEKKLEDKTVSLEARRRVESLMEKTKTVLSGEELRAIRGIEVLEGIGTPDAKEVMRRRCSTPWHMDATAPL